MKKLKFLSMILAVLTAITCFTALPVSAAVKKPSSIDIVYIPDDIFAKSPDELLHGIQVKISYTDKTSATYTVSKDNIALEESQDDLATTGSSQSVAIVATGENSGFVIYAYNYVSDFIEFSALTSDADYVECTKSISYPENYNCPEVFTKDYLIYKTNPDDTLTLINHHLFPFENDDDLCPEIVIPETVHGKTVTAVGNYALLGSEHPSSVTIPSTVTSIGEYAFGYCIDLYSGGDNHMVPDNVLPTRLSWKLAEADDSEKFIVRIQLYGLNPRTQGSKLKATYFPDCTDYKYDADEEEACATITKAQIYSMKDVEDISISLEYSKTPFNGMDEIYDFAGFIKDGEKIPVSISVFAFEEAELQALGEEFSKKYFGGRTDYKISQEDCAIIIDATLSEIEAVAADDMTSYVEVNKPYGVTYDLYKKLYYENNSFKTDIFIQDLLGMHTDTDYKILIKNYFSGCKYEIFNCENTEILIIKNASKQQILNASSNEAFAFEYNTFAPPILNPYGSIVIYGASGSTAQTYAEENAIKFVSTGSIYKLGDANLDGKVTVEDATLILKANVELVTITDEQRKLADFDQNGTVNVIDASELQKALVM